MEHSNIVKGAAKAASYNMLLQFGLRITTFVLNGFILRYVAQETLGIVNVRLTLLYSTTLFLAKEAFERACLSKIVDRDWRQVVFLGISQGIKCILTVVLVLLVPEWGIINFSIAQVTSSIVYVLLYHGYFIHYISRNSKRDDDFPLKSVRSIYPCKIEGKPCIDAHMASLTLSFFKQSFLKQTLTEGEKYVMTFFHVLSFGDQGIYDVINNLGSLAARFIFLPIEENSYLLFSQLLVRGVPPAEQNQDSLHLAAKILGVLLKVVTLIGVIIVVFGYSNAFLALHIYGGSILSSGTGPTLLRWLCFYVLVIALNGTSEAFVFAAMRKDEVDRYNHKMLLFSGVFLLSSWIFTQLVGSVGFIWANCLNMAARIAHSIYFIERYFESSGLTPLRQAVISVPVVLSLLVSFIITATSEHFLCSQSVVFQLIHVVITAACLLAVLAIVYVSEHNMVSFMKEQFLKGKTGWTTEDKNTSNSKKHS
ncbi:protein rft1 homolog [Plakobranchus ocellatus]|uniref:Protein RFT1 homolog n=1 Tax=Plakobranchus ocellatus TaxID=259542 RepID=A0AAV3ZUW6_9GAST|nr:protein rft1 homolog [Plakobranchus ocellatus]